MDSIQIFPNVDYIMFESIPFEKFYMKKISDSTLSFCLMKIHKALNCSNQMKRTGKKGNQGMS